MRIKKNEGTDLKPKELFPEGEVLDEFEEELSIDFFDHQSFQGEEIPEQRTNQYSIRGYDHNRAISRMKRAIYILRKRYGIELNRNCYNILLSKNLIPLVKEKKHMGFERFKFYFYEVTKGKVGDVIKPKDYVRQNCKIKTVDEIAKDLNKSRTYVLKALSDIRRGR